MSKELWINRPTDSKSSVGDLDADIKRWEEEKLSIWRSIKDYGQSDFVRMNEGFERMKQLQKLIDANKRKIKNK